MFLKDVKLHQENEGENKLKKETGIRNHITAALHLVSKSDLSILKLGTLELFRQMPDSGRR